MEKVIIEFIDEEEPTKVAVYPYDTLSREIIDSPEVMDFNEAKKLYKIVGTIIEGEIELNEDDEDEDDYFDEDDDDEDARY